MKPIRCVLAATANLQAIETLKQCFSGSSSVRALTRPEELSTALEEPGCDTLFLDMEFLAAVMHQYKLHSPVEVITTIKHRRPNAALVVMAAHENIRQSVEAVQHGADNYLSYPIVEEEVRFVLKSLSEQIRFEAVIDHFQDSFWNQDPSGITRTNSVMMHNVLDKAKAVAPTSTLVLLTGESGTGKSVIAKLIHDHSIRTDKPFIHVHCGAIPDTLVESELFGHEKGAFTNAYKRKLGKFELAYGGTIFLDEIGTISAAAQVKLLQVLQEKTFQRVGGEAEIKAGARVIAATNMDLKQMVAEGHFREDLFYRLNVFPIYIPPLRERKEDISILVSSFLEKFNREHHKTITKASPAVLDALRCYSWPGNVRELENVIERAFILETSDTLQTEVFPEEIIRCETPVANITLDMSVTLKEFRNQAKEEAERHYLVQLLSDFKGKINKSADHAGLTPRQLHKLLTKYGIHKQDFK